MARFIMLSLLGILTVFLLLNFIAFVGMSTCASMLEKKIIVDHVNDDIDFLYLQLSHSDPNVAVCQKLEGEMMDLKNWKLPKRCTFEKMDSSGFQVGETSYRMALCYEEQTKNCLVSQAKGCIQKMLPVYVECLAISGYYLKIEFSDREEELHRNILALKYKSMNEREVTALSVEALSVFSNTISRLKEELITYN